MLGYAQIQIFHAVTTCGRYQGCLLLIFILHNVMRDITRTLPVGDMPYSKMAAPECNCWFFFISTKFNGPICNM